jgi:hypothetical protein
MRGAMMLHVLHVVADMIKHVEIDGDSVTVYSVSTIAVSCSC